MGMHDAARRRHALQLATQLPESREDALAVIAYLRSLVDTFMAPAEDQGRGAALLRLDGRATTLRASAMRVERCSGNPSGLSK